MNGRENLVRSSLFSYRLSVLLRLNAFGYVGWIRLEAIALDTCGFLHKLAKFDTFHGVTLHLQACSKRGVSESGHPLVLWWPNSCQLQHTIFPLLYIDFMIPSKIYFVSTKDQFHLEHGLILDGNL